MLGCFNTPFGVFVLYDLYYYIFLPPFVADLYAKKISKRLIAVNHFFARLQ